MPYMKKEKPIKRKGVRILAAVCGGFLGAAFLLVCALQIGLWVSDGIECWHPDYEKADLSAVLAQETLSESDYELLYRQTGLTRLGIDRALARGTAGIARIKAIQDRFFTESTTVRDPFAPWTCTDHADQPGVNIFLEEGDVIVTSSTHISCFRVGHAGIVVDGRRERILQAKNYGEPSSETGADYFTDRVNFMILRPKAEQEVLEQAAAYAEENLKGIPYSAFAGIFTAKDSIQKTQCAHLVWYAYRQFGLDLDGNGGAIVLPFDLANSSQMELVQVFGFDPDRLWDRLFY